MFIPDHLQLDSDLARGRPVRPQARRCFQRSLTAAGAVRNGLSRSYAASAGESGATTQSRHGCRTIVLRVDTPEGVQPIDLATNTAGKPINLQ
jgi:hypothetical protein